MSYQHIQIPAEGQAITANEDLSLNVPDNPVIPYIEGDGIGVDISPVMIQVVDAAVEKAYQGSKKIAWMEIFAGEKATSIYGEDEWLPDESLAAMRDYIVSIKGHLAEDRSCAKGSHFTRQISTVDKGVTQVNFPSPPLQTGKREFAKNSRLTGVGNARKTSKAVEEASRSWEGK